MREEEQFKLRHISFLRVPFDVSEEFMSERRSQGVDG